MVLTYTAKYSERQALLRNFSGRLCRKSATKKAENGKTSSKEFGPLDLRMLAAVY